MQLIRFVAPVVAALAATAAQASATFSFHVQGEAAVSSLLDGDGTVPWLGTLSIVTPDGADGTYVDPRVRFTSNLALTDFDTASEPFPAEEITVTLQGGHVTSLFGGWVDGSPANGWWRNTFFDGNAMTEEYFDYFDWIQASGTIVAVDEPQGLVLVLAGLAATSAWARCRRRPAQA